MRADFFISNSLFRERKRRKKMFALQLGLNGERFVLVDSVRIGVSKLKDDDIIYTLKLYTDEYFGQLGIVKEAIQSQQFPQNIKNCHIENGQLIVGMYRKEDIKEIVFKSIFPMRGDCLMLQWLDCRKCWVIKMSASGIKRELTSQGVIK